MSSLPVPVSPWIRTVESVGATRSTCSSTDSKAELLPMICSNLRSSETRSPLPTLSKAPIQEPPGVPRQASLQGWDSNLQSRSNILKQNFIVKRFGQELYRACS